MGKNAFLMSSRQGVHEMQLMGKVPPSPDNFARLDYSLVACSHLVESGQNLIGAVHPGLPQILNRKIGTSQAEAILHVHGNVKSGPKLP